MSLNSTYHKITGYATLFVLLWNIVGWLGFGLILDHSHKHSEKNQCEVTFCYCEVEEGETTCTCHHSEMNRHNSDTTQANDFCFYSVPHSDANTASQALIVIAKFNAINLNSDNLKIPSDSHDFQAEQEAHLLPGSAPNLLRPPQV